jgi:hypothetical protein
MMSEVKGLIDVTRETINEPGLEKPKTFVVTRY